MKQFIIVIATIIIVYITHSTSIEIQFEVDMIAIYMIFIRPFVGVDANDIDKMM